MSLLGEATIPFPAGPAPDRAAGEGGDGFVTMADGRWARIANVDRLDPFLMSIASDSDLWLFVGSNGTFTTGRRDPDRAIVPYVTVDKLLGAAAGAGALARFRVTRHGRTALWEPWQEGPRVDRIERTLYKRIDETTILFEETNHDLGLVHRWSLSACEQFGLVRRSELVALGEGPVGIEYLDGFRGLLPPGVGRETYDRLSYLASAYMRHERVPGTPLALFALTAAISDRPEPSESLRTTVGWTVGHRAPTILLSDRQVAAFDRGEPVEPESEIRGEFGAYLVADRVQLEPGGRHAWTTVIDTWLDHPAVIELREALADPAALEARLEAALEENREGIRRRIATADGLQRSADEAVTANHLANVLFNVMRGGSFDHGYEVPIGDLAAFLRERDHAVAARHADWLAALTPGLTIDGLQDAARATGDLQLARIVRTYLPLTFSRRHGDPSRPWNRFSISVRSSDGRPVYGYEGNWRDIFQNWEALAVSFPGYLPGFIAVFLDASTADGYNPYRITRAGIDWESVDPRDPWSHIGYWGDHQLLYLLRLLEAEDRHRPGALAASLGERRHAYAHVPYRIADFEAILADPRSTIEFDRDLHERLVAEAATAGGDAKLLRDASGEVRLVTLAEKLLVPVLVKLTNLVPGGGIWLNTQRPEWNDANNALAGWGLSMVTVSAVRRYLLLLEHLVGGTEAVEVSASVAELLERLTAILGALAPHEVGRLDDGARYRAIEALGRAGEAHRRRIYEGDPGAPVTVGGGAIHEFIRAALPVVEATIRAGRMADGLYASYNVLRIDGHRAAVAGLGPMLEGQVAVLESGLLSDAEAVDLLRALRGSEMYRPDQSSYLLYPDRALPSFLERNTLAGPPPIADPRLFVRDRAGAWHFQADLSTVSDVDQALVAAGADAATSVAVRALWSATFAHDEFTGRSGRFFMFEGLGSIYWHMVAKLLVAVGDAHARATDPVSVAGLAARYAEIRDGLDFRKTPTTYGAFPTDPYSHTPRHRGAQQPGMTGQVKEQILTRFTELGVSVRGGRIRFEPRLLADDELDPAPADFVHLDLAGRERTWSLPSRSLAFTYCGLPVCYRVGEAASIELLRADGARETHRGSEVPADASRAIFERDGTYERAIVTLVRRVAPTPSSVSSRG